MLQQLLSNHGRLTLKRRKNLKKGNNAAWGAKEAQIFFTHHFDCHRKKRANENRLDNKKAASQKKQARRGKIEW